MKSQIILGSLFISLSKRYIAQVTDKLQNLDIKRHYYALFALDSADHAMTQSELADFIGVDKVSLVRLADYLEDNGYIKRRVSSEDRRKQYLDLLPKAHKVMPEIRAAFASADQTMLSMLNPDEQSQFLDICRRMESWLDEHPTDHIRVNMNYSRVKV